MKNHFKPYLQAAVLGLAAMSVAAMPAHAATRAGDESAAASAQAVRPKVKEIERGLWFSLESGPLLHTEWMSRIPPQNLPRQLFPDDGGTGLRMGGRVGYDIMGLFSVDGYGVGQFREKRIRRGRSYTGDLTDLNAGIGLRVMPITIKDRLSFTGRVGLGFAFLMPGEVARAYTNPGCLPPAAGTEPLDMNPACLALPGIQTPSNPAGFYPFPSHVIFVTPSTEVMVGVEYFTKLRHFSIGVDLQAGMTPWPFQLSTAIVPHVKYTLF